MLKGLNLRIDKTVSFSSKHPCRWLSSAKTQMLLYTCVFLETLYQKIPSLYSCPRLLKKHCCCGSRAAPSPGNTQETCTPQAGGHWAPRKQSCVPKPFGMEGFLPGLADSHPWNGAILLWKAAAVRRTRLCDTTDVTQKHRVCCSHERNLLGSPPQGLAPRCPRPVRTYQWAPCSARPRPCSLRQLPQTTPLCRCPSSAAPPGWAAPSPSWRQRGCRLRTDTDTERGSTRPPRREPRAALGFSRGFGRSHLRTTCVIWALSVIIKSCLSAIFTHSTYEERKYLNRWLLKREQGVWVLFVVFFF